MKCQPSGLLDLVDRGNVWTGPGVQQHVLREQQSHAVAMHIAIIVHVYRIYIIAVS